MKKIKRVLITLIITLTLFLTGCSEIEGSQVLCKHEYEVSSTEASCTNEGETVYKCSKCGREITVVEKTRDHNYEILEFRDSTCSIEGYKKEKCSNCNKVIETTIDKKEHTLGEWVLTHELIDSFHNEESNECSVCHEKVTRLVSTVPPMDLSAIKYDINKPIHIASNLEETGVIFNSTILNMKEEIEIKLDFEVKDFDKFMDKLSDLRSVESDYEVSSNFNPLTKVLKLAFNYQGEPSKTTPKIVSYVQAPSNNISNINKKRSADFNEFSIESVTETYSVTTTDQLVYALEHRVKPLPTTSSKAESIYNKIKVVLRNIINDDMSDVEKVKAIHDWLIMNVTYDQELLSLLETNESDIKKYNGFYLEGVFDDGYAVCEGISKALCAMANIEGIPCVRVSGHKTGVTGGVGHAWNKIYVQGDWYIIDATSDGTIINGETEILSYQFFLISDEKMKVKYTGEEYNDYLCTKDYDYFLNNPLINNDEEIKLSIDSQEELNKLIDYFVKNATSKATIQFRINFNYGDSYSDEVATAYSLAHGTKSYGFVKNDNVVLIMLNE